MNTTHQRKEASQLLCPTGDCPARGTIDAGTIVSPGKKRERSTGTRWRRTGGAHQGTLMDGLRTPEERIVIVVTPVASGCPVHAMVHALGVDERTVARWQERAGAPGQKVHTDQVLQGKLDLQHVHADEIRGKGWTMIPWIGMASMVSTRVWVGGVVRLRRDRRLADDLLTMVNAWCHPVVAVVVLTDGWAASPGRRRRVFREKVKGVAGRGRRLHAWPEIVRETVITQTATQRVVAVIRR
jgi:hypothetical protein